MSRRRRTRDSAGPRATVTNIEDARDPKSLEARTDAEVNAMRLEQRLDRWVNYMTGLGTLEDKTRASFFENPWRLMDTEISALVSGNDLAARGVEKRPNEMFRRGYMLEGQKPGAVDKSKIDELMTDATERLLANVRLHEGVNYGRQYGGSVLILGINDGRPPDAPVDEENIESVDYINQVDRRFAYVQSLYSDFLQPKYGEPEIYMVSNGVATSSYRSADGSNFGYRRKSPDRLMKQGSSVVNIHESRIIRFDGVMPDPLTRQMLAGWSWSVLQRPYEILRMCDGAFDALAYLISDASQGVLKLKGLFQAINSGNESKIQARLSTMEKTRSVMRSIALDAAGDEDFTRVTTPLTGIPDSIDRIMQRTAAAFDCPVTELFGISPAGLNATGESDRIKWYDTIGSEQTSYLGPKIKRLYRLLALAKDSPFRGQDIKFKVKFHPLYAPTDDEVAKTRYTNAQRDALYVTNEIVTPEQVQLTLTEVYPSIDADEIEEEIEAKTKFDPYEKDPIAGAEAQAEANKPPPPPPPAPGVPVGHVAALLGAAGKGANPGGGKRAPGDPKPADPKDKPTGADKPPKKATPKTD